MNLHFLASVEEEEEYTIFKRNFLESIQDLIIKKIKAGLSAAQTALVLLHKGLSGVPTFLSLRRAIKEPGSLSSGLFSSSLLTHSFDVAAS